MTTTMKVAKFIARNPLRPFQAESSFSCNICGYEGLFLDKRSMVAGGLVYRARRCPSCESGSRLRLVVSYFQSENIDLESPQSLLHFAPERAFANYIKPYQQVKYSTADPMMDGVDISCGMESIPLPDSSCNMIMANHVLEHVEDVEASLAELRRVLRKDGQVLFTIPIDWDLKNSYSVEKELDPVTRIRLFGASDHVRQFGSDFSNILESNAFQVSEFRNEEGFRKAHRINNDEDVLFVLRPINE